MEIQPPSDNSSKLGKFLWCPLQRRQHSYMVIIIGPRKFYLVGKTPILDSHGIYLLLSRKYFMKPSGLSTFLLFYIKSAKYSGIGIWCLLWCWNVHDPYRLHHRAGADVQDSKRILLFLSSVYKLLLEFSINQNWENCLSRPLDVCQVQDIY